MPNDSTHDLPDFPADPLPPEEHTEDQSNLFDGAKKINGKSTSRWKANHGSFLLLFFSVIVMFGFTLIWYQQTRFVPPKFPDSGMIQTIVDDSDTKQVIPDMESMIGIRIAGAPNNNGTIKVAIHANVESFLSEDQSLISQSIPLKNGESIWLLQADSLPEMFAVAAYHDENDDQELTMNRFGIPSERFGFSREARGIAGPPRFQDAVIQRPEPGSLIYIFLR